MVTSFNKIQLANVCLWSQNNVTQTSPNFTQDFLKAIETAEFDEKGKKMDEKSRNRLGYAIKAIGAIANQKDKISQIQGQVQVWQVGPEDDRIEIRWDVNRSSKNPRLTRR